MIIRKLIFVLISWKSRAARRRNYVFKTEIYLL